MTESAAGPEGPFVMGRAISAPAPAAECLQLSSPLNTNPCIMELESA
jgi:hypothetical protein